MPAPDGEKISGHSLRKDRGEYLSVCAGVHVDDAGLHVLHLHIHDRSHAPEHALPGMTLTPRAFGTSRTEGPGGKADDVELAASFHFGLDDIENGQNAALHNFAELRASAERPGEDNMTAAFPGRKGGQEGRKTCPLFKAGACHRASGCQENFFNRIGGRAFVAEKEP